MTNEIKVGSKVVYRKGHEKGSSTFNGGVKREFATVDRIEDGYKVYFKETGFWASINELEVYKEMTTFKTGDTVKVIKDTSCHCFPIGTVLTVGKVDRDHNSFRAKHESNTNDPNWTWNVNFEDVVPHVEPVVAQFKLGDKVKILSKSVGCDFKHSTVVKKANGVGYVVRVKGGNEYSVSEKKDGFGDFFHANDLELYVEKKYKVGDKVVPHAKTASGWEQDLNECSVYRGAKAKKQPYVYVVGFSEEGFLVLNEDKDAGYDGNFYNESDVTPYVEELTEYKGYREGSEFMLYGDKRVIKRDADGYYFANPKDNYRRTTGKSKKLDRLIETFITDMKEIPVPAQRSFQVGDKVVPFKKTYPNFGDLPASNVWKRAKAKGDKYVVIGRIDGNCYVLRPEGQDWGGDYFAEGDFELYDFHHNVPTVAEMNQGTIELLEKQLKKAHEKTEIISRQYDQLLKDNRKMKEQIRKAKDALR